jgi:hypothetical protein
MSATPRVLVCIACLAIPACYMHYKDVPLRKVKINSTISDWGKPLEIGAASRKCGPDG